MSRAITYSYKLVAEQKEAVEGIRSHPFNIILGMAGSGKTSLAVRVGLDKLFKKEVEEIIITRPAVGTEDLGFLPGDKNEKLSEWLAPVYACMKEVYGGTTHKDKTMENLEKCIHPLALQHVRGRNFRNAFVICDEFQNMTLHQFKMVFSRLCEGATIVFTGDAGQIDLKSPHTSAIHAVDKIKVAIAEGNLEDVYIQVLQQNHRAPVINKLLEILK